MNFENKNGHICGLNLKICGVKEKRPHPGNNAENTYAKRETHMQKVNAYMENISD